jgi:NDP-sugar pyrophosphorylase family protein
MTALADIPALVLAGGAGTRLRSVVSDRPKPMAPVAGRPFLELQVGWLARQGVRRVVLCTGYLHEQVRSHFGDGRAFGVEIEYSVERSPLGTAGALKLAEGRAGRGPFLVANGDSFLDVDLAGLVRAHAAHRAGEPGCVGTLVLCTVPDAREFGSVRLDARRRVVSFDEKAAAPAGPALVNAGVYCLEPALLELVSPGRSVSLERETFPFALSKQLALFGHPVEGGFVDIGTPRGYERMCRQQEQQRQQQQETRKE